jgi:FK506-binding protein-like
MHYFTVQAKMEFFIPQAIWIDEAKGLRKEVSNFKYVSTIKATELSKCMVIFSDIINNTHKESNYLRNGEVFIEMGSALTPIDCYIENFLLQMHLREESRCSIRTRSGDEISFILKLMKVEFGGYYCELSADQMYQLGQKYKENGVSMYKEYPKFAQQYFSKAAKCLLSYSALRDVEGQLEEESPPSPIDDILEKMTVLLETVYMNLSMCLIKQNRFEDVVYLMAFVDKQENPSEKAVYRKALAHYHLKQFEEAKLTLEKVDFASNRDLTALWAKLYATWKSEENKYSEMVKKMFRS